MLMPEILRDAGSYASVGATLGILLLLPLYFSQRRDVHRLRRWHELEPERGEPVTDTLVLPGAASRTETGELTALGRITADRPALERITAERARLQAEPWWKRLIRRLPEPRHPMLIAAGAFLVGAGIFIGAMQIADPADPEPAKRGSARTETTVAVLNGSEISGLAGRVGDDVKVNGFGLGRVTSIPKSYSQTVVMFSPGHERQGRQVAKALGVKPVQPIDRPSAKAAGPGTDVVVIAGDDRAR